MAVAAKDKTVLSSWPTDDNGDPLAQVSMAVHELIGLPQYSNVTIGPAVVTRFVRDTKDDRENGLKECSEEVEKVVSVIRDEVLENIGRK